MEPNWSRICLWDRDSGKLPISKSWNIGGSYHENNKQIMAFAKGRKSVTYKLQTYKRRKMMKLFFFLLLGNAIRKENGTQSEMSVNSERPHDTQFKYSPSKARWDEVGWPCLEIKLLSRGMLFFLLWWLPSWKVEHIWTVPTCQRGMGEHCIFFTFRDKMWLKTASYLQRKGGKKSQNYRFNL